MQYQKTVILKDGTPCVLRGATEKDAAEVLRCFSPRMRRRIFC